MPGPDPRTRRTKEERSGMGLKGAGKNTVKRPKILIKKVGDPSIIFLDKDTIEKIKKGEKVFKKGGRAGFKAGSKGCKLSEKGRGRAYGKNS